MARNTNIKLRRSATQGSIPTTSNLDLGELAINTYDGKLYVKKTFGSLDRVVQVGSSSYSYNLATGVTETLTVTVASTTSDHRYNGTGSSNKYFINGVPSPYLKLVPGVTYKFDQSDSSNSGHPFRFYYEAAKTTAYTTGVTTNGTPGSSGAYTQILATDSTPPVLHYQCSAHANMGNQASFATRNLTGFDTDDLTEGSSNLYYTDARARAAISASGDLSYNNSTGVMSFTQRTDAQVRGLISVTDAGGDGSLAYNNSTGVITYTGPSASEVRAHFSAGTGVSISSGQISIGQAVATSDDVTFNDLTVAGDLTVQGTTTTLNTATLDVEDKNITLNFGSGDTSGSANGAGITIQDAVNSSTDATLLWDASNDRFDFSHPLEITTTTTDDTLLLTATEASSTASPVLTFKRNSSSPADADYLGQLKFKGENDADQEVVYAKITAKIQDVTDTTEDGLLEFANRKAGSNVITARLRSDSLQLLNGTSLVVAGLTYPTSDGSSGQALVTDGSGNLSFSSISAGGNAFGTIAVSGQSDVVADSNSDTLTLVAGSNITLTTNASGDSVTIASSASGSVSEAFKTIAVSGQSDVVADSATDTLTLAAGSGMSITTDASTDTITFVSSGGSSQSAVYEEYVYTATNNQTAFSGSDDNSNTLSYTPGFLMVFINGVLQDDGTDYTATNGTTVTLVNGASTSDLIQISTFVQIIGKSDANTDEFTGNGSTTAYTLTVNPNHEDNTMVYINGVYQEKATYSVSGTTLTFSTAPPNGSSIEVVSGSRNITVDDVSGLTIEGDLIVNDGSRSLTYDVSAGELNHTGATLNINKTNGVDTAIGTDDFYVDASTSRVGIGTTSPSFTLHVLDTIGTRTLSLGHGVSSGTITTDSAKDLNFQQAGTTKMTLDSSGKLGIGTTSPALELHVDGDARVDSNNGLAAKKIRSSYFSSSQDLTLESGASGDIILSSTNVGIGTTTPAVGLDIGSKTDAVRVPNGTTAQRPTAALGQIRYNTTTSEFEGYAAGAWGKIGGGGDSFGTIAVSGQTNVVAEQENDTLTLVGQNGITITTTAGSDTVTFDGNRSVNPFVTDLFTASGSAAFTLSTTPSSENNLIVFLEGVYQNKNSYTLSGTTLTLDSAPSSGEEVVVHIIGDSVVGGGHTVNGFTGDNSTTAFTLTVEPMNKENTIVYLDGVYQHKSEYSVSGTTLTFTTAPGTGDDIEVLIGTPVEINQPGSTSIDNTSQFDTSAIIPNAVTSTTVASTSATTIATHAIATFRTVKYLVQCTQGTDYHSTEINVIHDGTTAYMTEYGTLFDNAALGTFDVAVSGGNLLLQITAGSATSMAVKVVSTAIPV